MANDNRQNKIISVFPDTPFFRKLVCKTKIKLAYKTALSNVEIENGERSEQKKKKIVEQCKWRWKSSTNKINEMIDVIFQSIPYYKEKEIDLEKIREDMLFAYYAYGFLPNEYFAFRLENKPPELRKEFISSRLRIKFRCQMNNILQAHIFNDKAETYEF